MNCAFLSIEYHPCRSHIYNKSAAIKHFLFDVLDVFDFSFSTALAIFYLKNISLGPIMYLWLMQFSTRITFTFFWRAAPSSNFSHTSFCGHCKIKKWNIFKFIWRVDCQEFCFWKCSVNSSSFIARIIYILCDEQGI